MDRKLHIWSHAVQMRQHSSFWFILLFLQLLAWLDCVGEIWMTMPRSKRHSSSSTSDNKDTNKAPFTDFHWRMKKPIIGPFVCFLWNGNHWQWCHSNDMLQCPAKNSCRKRQWKPRLSPVMEKGQTPVALADMAQVLIRALYSHLEMEWAHQTACSVIPTDSL